MQLSLVSGDVLSDPTHVLLQLVPHPRHRLDQVTEHPPHFPPGQTREREMSGTLLGEAEELRLLLL